MDSLVVEGPISANSLDGLREQLDRKAVAQVIQDREGNITQAAADLGISREGLYYLMKRRGVTVKRG